ncbi:DoxX family protein [Streptomyces sp. NPDC016845]|uniref:DoxX family protein n=1 Tax=Streptomyces sp. NPDC016845 TaxID=3364972 RepID=UPI0037A2E55B
MRIVAAAASALVIFEFGLAAVTWTPALQVAVERFSQVAHVPPSPRAVSVIGLLDLIGVAGAIVGFWKPQAAVAAGVWFAALCGWILFRQLTHGDRGSALLPYTLFACSALLMLIGRLAES